MYLYLYSENRIDVGFKNLTISAYLEDYPEVKTDEVFAFLVIEDNPCAFEELTLMPNPF